MPKKKLSKVILDPIEEKLNKALYNTAEDVLVEIEAAFESVIEKFYEDYTPRNGNPYYYRRTGSTFYGSNAYNNLINPETLYYEKDIPITGIDIHSSFIEKVLGNPYNADMNSPAWVFNRTFYEGIHGFTEVEAETWSKDTHKNRKGKKSRFHKPKNIPTQTTPVPKELMDAKFKDISSIDHLNELLNKNIRKILKNK